MEMLLFAPIIFPIFLIVLGVYWLGWPVLVWVMLGCAATGLFLMLKGRAYAREEWSALQYMPLTGPIALIIAGAEYARHKGNW